MVDRPERLPDDIRMQRTCMAQPPGRAARKKFETGKIRLELRTMRTLSITLAIALMISITIPATAHHSAAAQDFNKTVELDGIVKSWQIMNPHGRLVVEVSDAKGKRTITLETHSRNNVYRAGYRDGMVKAGDKIRVFIAPNRDGSDGGYLVAFVSADGTRVGLDASQR